MAVASKRNGKVEFFRFVFCMIVMLYHFGSAVFGKSVTVFGPFTFFARGYFGVEFFFLVSGYLMGASVYRASQKPIAGLGGETVKFTLHKVMAVLPYHLLVFPVTLLVFLALKPVRPGKLLATLYSYLPNFLLLSKLGLPGTDLIGVEWYLSVMFVAMFLLYPLCRKDYELFSRVAAPLVSLFLVGFLCIQTGCLSGINATFALCTKPLLRAICEICLGIFLFEAVRFLKTWQLDATDRAVLTLLELAAYGITLLFTISNWKAEREAVLLLCLALGVGLSFSGLTYFGELFQNRVVYFLGKLSLPMYLWQSLSKKVITYALLDWSAAQRLAVFLGLTCLLAVISMPLEQRLRAGIQGKMRRLFGYTL